MATEHQAAGDSLVSAATESRPLAPIAAVFERDGPPAVAGFQEVGRIDDPTIEIETSAVVPPAAADGVVLASW